MVPYANLCVRYITADTITGRDKEINTYVKENKRIIMDVHEK